MIGRAKTGRQWSCPALHLQPHLEKPRHLRQQPTAQEGEEGKRSRQTQRRQQAAERGSLQSRYWGAAGERAAEGQQQHWRHQADVQQVR